MTTDELVSLGDLVSQGRPAALLFTDPGCAPCGALLPEVSSWQASGRLLAVVGVGAAELNRATAAEHGLSHVLLQEAREVADAYGVAGTPAAVVVDGDGRVAQPVVYGAEAVRDVIASLEPARRPTRVAVGAAAARCCARACSRRGDRGRRVRVPGDQAHHPGDLAEDHRPREALRDLDERADGRR